MSGVPHNIQEFNSIAGLSFAQLYKAFPLVKDIDRAAIAKAMGVAGDAGDAWEKHILLSGRSFNNVLGQTIGWLNTENYIRAHGRHPSERVILTTQGLAVMNAVPSGLKVPLGVELGKAVEHGSTTSGYIGDLMGNLFAGFVKNISSG
jgi:hypothetical protein